MWKFYREDSVQEKERIQILKEGKISAVKFLIIYLDAEIGIFALFKKLYCKKGENNI